MILQNTPNSGEKFDFHGECDLVLLQTNSMRIHIRTKIESWWSFIESAVVEMGENQVLEVSGLDGGKYWVNGVAGKAMQVHDKVKTEFAGHKITITQSSQKQLSIRIDLGNSQALGISTFKSWVSVNLSSKATTKGVAFEGAKGLMGSFPQGEKLARDGTTVIDDSNQFGMEWQVRPDEPVLFREVGAVQAPAKCKMPNQTTKKLRRRLLGRDGITEEDAATACEHVDEEDRDGCIFDVLATNDKDMAGAY